jgi:tetratricopeptide (TPR) repeat protein
MMMDCFGRSHTATSRDAIAAFEKATLAIAAHRLAAPSLARALELEPDLPAAWALRSLGNAMLGRSEGLSAAKTDAAKAEAALSRCHGGTAGERALAAAANHAASGRLQAAAVVLEDHLDSAPRDLLAAKLSHSLRFMSGQPDRMLATSSKVLPHWSADAPGFGFLMGCHAFGLEEVGRYSEAEAAGRRAVKLEPGDAWGRHAVSHVMEMSGRIEDGIAWLEASRPIWPECNNFRFHLAWHLALFHLEHGNHTGVLALYDHDVMPMASDDFRDMANAISLLWRLRQSGVPVGDRWERLRDIALKRRSDVTYVFASLHYLLALVANKEVSAAASLLDELEHVADGDTGDQAHVARNVGVELAHIIQTYANSSGKPHADMSDIARRLSQLGGSNAQRDLFVRILLEAASIEEDRSTLTAITRLRSQLRWQDRFLRGILAARSMTAFIESRPSFGGAK